MYRVEIDIELDVATQEEADACADALAEGLNQIEGVTASVAVVIKKRRPFPTNSTPPATMLR